MDRGPAKDLYGAQTQAESGHAGRRLSSRNAAPLMSLIPIYESAERLSWPGVVTINDVEAKEQLKERAIRVLVQRHAGRRPSH